MQQIRDRYQMEEEDRALSFRPFYHARSKLKWYMLAIVSFGALSVHFFDRRQEMILIVLLTFFVVTCWFFIKELLVYIPMKYIFDLPSNTVYQSNLFVKKKIMELGEIIIFRSSEYMVWHYALGQKRKQFVKSYPISESFSKQSESQERVLLYERELLGRIRELSDAAVSNNKTNTESVNFR